MSVSGHPVALKIGGVTVTKAYFNGKLVFETSDTSTSDSYMYFASSAKFTMSMMRAWDGTLQYSTNKTSWSTWDGSEITAVRDSSDRKYKVYFRGIGNTQLTGGMLSTSGFTFSGNGTVSVVGSLYSLLDYKTASEPDDMDMGDYCFSGLFYGCTSLISCECELSGTYVPVGGYANMFSGCTALETAPTIYAETVSAQGMYNMFYNCSALTSVQDELYISTINESGCENMYANCSGLTKLPTLTNSMRLQGAGALKAMFSGCSAADNGTALYVSLKSTSESGCESMFEGCGITRGATINCSAAVAKACFKFMYKDCTSMTDGGTISLGKQSCGESAFNNMYVSCTALEHLPTFTGYKLTGALYVCESMFASCSSLHEVWSFASLGPGVTSIYYNHTTPYVGSMDNMYFASGVTFYDSNPGGGLQYQFSTAVTDASFVYLTPFKKVSATDTLWVQSYITIITLNG